MNSPGWNPRRNCSPYWRARPPTSRPTDWGCRPLATCSRTRWPPAHRGCTSTPSTPPPRHWTCCTEPGFVPYPLRPDPLQPEPLQPHPLQPDPLRPGHSARPTPPATQHTRVSNGPTPPEPPPTRASDPNGTIAVELFDHSNRNRTPDEHPISHRHHPRLPANRPGPRTQTRRGGLLVRTYRRRRTATPRRGTSRPPAHPPHRPGPGR